MLTNPNLIQTNYAYTTYGGALQPFSALGALGSTITTTKGVATLNLASGFGINIISYGADPSGVADSTLSIQAAINAASIAKTYIFVPPGTYKITTTLNNTIAPNFMGIVGISCTTSVISGTTLTTDAMVFNNIPVGFQLLNFEVSGPGQMSAHTSSGIKLPVPVSGVIVQLSVRNVTISNFPTYGLYQEVPIVSIYDNVNCVLIGNTAFYTTGQGGSTSNPSGTSTTWVNCYANNVGNGSIGRGYYFTQHVYSSINSCAADNCNDSYYYYQCSGISENGCGNESNTYISAGLPGRGVVIDGSTALQINAHWCFDLPNTASIGYHTINSTENCTLISCVNLKNSAVATYDAVINGLQNTLINCTAQGHTPNDAFVVHDLGNLTVIHQGSTVTASQTIDTNAPELHVGFTGQSTLSVDANVNPDGTGSGGTSVALLQMFNNTQVTTLNKSGWSFEADPSSGDLFIFHPLLGVVNQAAAFNNDGSFLTMLTLDQGSGTINLGDGGDAGGGCSLEYVGGTGTLTITSGGGAGHIAIPTSVGNITINCSTAAILSNGPLTINSSINVGTTLDVGSSASVGTSLTAGGAFGIQGVGAAAQPTGYGTPTGGSHQGSFVASTITLPLLAAAVAQLINDLKSYGLLGG